MEGQPMQVYTCNTRFEPYPNNSLQHKTPIFILIFFLFFRGVGGWGWGYELIFFRGGGGCLEGKGSVIIIYVMIINGTALLFPLAFSPHLLTNETKQPRSASLFFSKFPLWPFRSEIDTEYINGKKMAITRSPERK